MIVILFSICLFNDLTRVYPKALVAGPFIQPSGRNFWSSDWQKVPLCSSICFIACTLHKHLLSILSP